MTDGGGSSETRLRLGTGGRRVASVAALAGAAGWAATIALAAASDHGLERFFHAYLVSFSFYLSLALGALFFVLLGHLTRAGWSVVLRRVAEAVSLAVVPLGALALLVFLGRHELYEWTHAEAVAADPLLQHKQAYLNTDFFLVRILLYFATWSAMALYFARASARQDASGEPGATVRMERLAAVATIAYAVTVTFAAFDLLMSLYPHWYSTIYGVYFFAGAVVGAFSLVTLLVFALQRAGRLEVVTTEHYHDLGKLTFGFVVFWAYVAFSQYMLIWYAHVPEETSWYLVRQQGPWLGLSLLLLFGHFVAPFLLLISRVPKRRPGLLAAVAAWVLVMHALDLYWLVMPEASPDRSPFHPLDLSCGIAVGGIFLATVFWWLSRTALVPLRDPRLGESLELENA